MLANITWRGFNDIVDDRRRMPHADTRGRCSISRKPKRQMQVYFLLCWWISHNHMSVWPKPISPVIASCFHLRPHWEVLSPAHNFYFTQYSLNIMNLKSCAYFLLAKVYYKQTSSYTRACVKLTELNHLKTVILINICCWTTELTQYIYT